MTVLRYVAYCVRRALRFRKLRNDYWKFVHRDETAAVLAELEARWGPRLATWDQRFKSLTRV